MTNTKNDYIKTWEKKLEIQKEILIPISELRKEIVLQAIEQMEASLNYFVDYPDLNVQTKDTPIIIYKNA